MEEEIERFMRKATDAIIVPLRFHNGSNQGSIQNITEVTGYTNFRPGSARSHW